MTRQSFDPGLTQQFSGRLRRTINRDGSFNVHRRGARIRNANVYLSLISMPWPAFFGLLLGAYFLINLLFAGLYVLAGIENLAGTELIMPHRPFWSAFFFSVHTLTTVGYGSVYPRGIEANSVAGIEAMAGLMGFATATGLLYGRVSRPSARIQFSDRMLVAPYQDVTALEFRIANQRKNILMDLEATVLLMTVVEKEGQLRRDYVPLELERSSVLFLPLTWTVVHPIVPGSPLFGKTPADLERLQAEVLILVRSFDDTFSQTVHARNSYRYDEIVWGAKFLPAFSIDPEGDMILELEQVSHYDPTP